MQPRMEMIKGMTPRGRMMGLAVLALWATCVGGQTDNNAPKQALTAKFPYLAEVTGSEVNVRSGPGTDHYDCGRVTLGDVVKVVGQAEGGWSEIVPPPSSFSWIAMRYVSINFDEPTVGIVTGQGVNVYAGSDYRTPIRSKAQQVQLNRGDKVVLLSEHDEDGLFYKIQPPKGSTLWISSRYLKKKDGTEPDSSVIATSEFAVDQAAAETEQQSEQADTESESEPTDVNTPAQSAALKTYYDCQARVQVELQKPVLEQSYADIKKDLTRLKEQTDAPRAAQYADYLLQRIMSYEMAVTVGQQIEEQAEQLSQTRERIRQMRTERLAQIQDLGRYAVVGTLKESSIYSERSDGQQYRIVNDADITLCYVRPTGTIRTADLSEYFDQKVGLIGTIKPYPAVGGALVEFSRIEKLD